MFQLNWGLGLETRPGPGRGEGREEVLADDATSIGRREPQKQKAATMLQLWPCRRRRRSDLTRLGLLTIRDRLVDGRTGCLGKLGIAIPSPEFPNHGDVRSSS